MAWTAPTTRSTSDLITASIWNTDLVDNLSYLKSQVNAQIQVSAGAMQPCVTQGAAFGELETTTNKINYRFMDFENIENTVLASFGIVMPSDYDGGTVTAIFHWTANSTSTNSVVWSLQGVAVADDGALDVAYGTSQVIADANKSSAYDLNITGATPAITIAGTPAAGKYVHFRVGRNCTNASDTLAATARLLAVVITYTRT